MQGRYPPSLTRDAVQTARRVRTVETMIWGQVSALPAPSYFPTVGRMVPEVRKPATGTRGINAALTHPSKAQRQELYRELQQFYVRVTGNRSLSRREWEWLAEMKARLEEIERSSRRRREKK